MGIRDPERYVPEDMIPGMKEEMDVPVVSGWPEDDFSHWVADHREEIRSTLCAAPDYIGASWCSEAEAR